MIDNSLADHHDPTDAIAAGGALPYPDETCPTCDWNLTASEGWCKCCADAGYRRYR